MRKYIQSAIDAWKLAAQVRQRHGKSLARQASEIRRLLSQNPTCGIYDYYQFALYDPTHLITGYASFAGWKTGGDISLALNPRNVVAPAWDKILVMLLLDAYGFQRPGLKAMYKRTGKVPAGVPVHLPSLEALRDFLRQSAHYPFYAKPVDSQQGIGGLLARGFDAGADALLTSGGHSLSIEDFFSRYIHNPSKYYREEAGYLFQEVIRQHEAVNRFQGHDTVSGIRLTLINTASGTVPIRAIWKLSMNDNPNDNFSLGKYGNLIAQVDLETGRPVYGLDGLWPTARRYETHPSTGNAFQDFVIPNWKRIVETAVEACAMIPKMLIQFWDIAVGPDGPIFIELNDIGGLEIMQLHGEGILGSHLMGLLRKRGKLRPGSPLQRLLEAQDKLAG
jgi:hypothetical protein